MSPTNERYWVIVGLLGIALVALVAAWLMPFARWYPGRWYLAICIFGMAVGGSELIGRYRDAPFRTLGTFAALFYVGINAAAAVCAYVLIRRFQLKFGFAENDPNLELVRALVAGFGSMAFFRSSLFNIKVEGTEVPVGPGIFFQVMLFAADRSCDRQRARIRAKLVTEIMNGVSFSAAHDALPDFCFELMQNLPSSEADRVRQAVKGLATAESVRDTDRTLRLGLMLMNVVGSPVLRTAVQEIGPRLQEPAKIELAVFNRLQDVDFKKAFPVLIQVCFVMAKFGTRADQIRAKDEVIAEITPLTTNPDLDNDTKVLMLALALQQRFGDGVLEAALTQLGKGIKQS